MRKYETSNKITISESGVVTMLPLDLEEAKLNAAKELKDVAKIDKLLEQAYKGMNKLYKTTNTKALTEVNDGIVEARRGLDKYIQELKDEK